MHARYSPPVLTKFWRALIGFVAVMGASMPVMAQFGPPAGGNEVVYNPKVTQQQQGIQPFSTFYDLTVTSPGNLAAGAWTISMILIVEEAPAGVDEATSLSFIRFVDPVLEMPKTTLHFTGPNQSQVVRVRTDIPIGSNDGTFRYFISTSGWPASFKNEGTRINAQAQLPAGLAPPTVKIDAPEEGTEYTHVLGGPAVPVRIEVSGAATPAAPVLSLVATLSGESEDGVPFLVDMPLVLSLTGLGTPDTQGQVTVPLTEPGTYTITAEATNRIGESFTSSTFVIVQEVPPPTVVINPPVNNPTYTYVRGLTSVTVPYAFVGSSLLGEIQTLTATLDGEPFTPEELHNLGTLEATGAGEFVFDANTPDGLGQHTIAVTATSPYGSATATATFVVAEEVPEISVDIANPIDGASIPLPRDASPLNLAFSFTGTATKGAPVTAISATLTDDDDNTTPLALASKTGLETPTATGAGTMFNLQPGTYTLSANATNTALGLSAFDSVTFTVTPPPPPVIAFTQAPDATYTTLRGQSLTIPFAIKTSSTGAYIVSQSVTLDGDPVTISSTANGTALVATGNGTLTIPAPTSGTSEYDLVATGVDAYGQTVSTQVSFKVTVNDPVITIAINPQIAANSPYTLPSNGTLSIPFVFTGKVTAGATVDTITGTLSGTPVTITSTTGLGTSSTATASGNLIITKPGTYTVTATDTNTAAGISATTSVTFEVKGTTAPSLKVTITQPPQSVYTVCDPCETLRIPVAFTAQSNGNKVKTLSATLDGKSVSLGSTSGLNTATAKGTATLSVREAGEHVLVVKATDTKGQVATTTVTFKVVVKKPEISLTIHSPSNGAVYSLAGDSRYCGDSSISIPFSFSSSISDGATIDGISAMLNGSSVSLSKSGVGTSNAKGSGTLKISKPGTYTFTAKSYDNTCNVSVTKSVTFTVKSAEPPTVTITSPTETNISIFNCQPRSVGFSFKVTSQAGGISKLTAKLDGSSLNVTATGLGSSNATGSGTMSVKTTGKHVLTVTATDKAGTTTKSFTFYAEAKTAKPSISILDPNNGEVFTYEAGKNPPSIPFSVLAKSNAPISAIKVALNGCEVNVSKTGIGSEEAKGTGYLTIKEPGTYTLTASTTSGGVSASTKVTFTVKKTQEDSKCGIDWRGFLKDGKSPKGGDSAKVECKVVTGSNKKSIRDYTVQFSVCEVRDNGSYGPAKIYGSSHYTINSDNDYCLKVPTSSGKKRYRVDVYYCPPGSNKAKVVGSKEFKTN